MRRVVSWKSGEKEQGPVRKAGPFFCERFRSNQFLHFGDGLVIIGIN